MNFDIFISCSSKDKAAADAACAALEADGMRCWIAPRDVLPGSDWSSSIIEAIDHCRVMVLIFSGSANELTQIRNEVVQAVNKGVPLVPMRIENVEPTKSLAYFMGAVHWLDATTPPTEQHLRHLRNAVKTLLRMGSNTTDVQTVAVGHLTDRGDTLAAFQAMLAITFGLFLIAAGVLNPSNRLGTGDGMFAEPQRNGTEIASWLLLVTGIVGLITLSQRRTNFSMSLASVTLTIIFGGLFLVLGPRTPVDLFACFLPPPEGLMGLLDLCQSWLLLNLALMSYLLVSGGLALLFALRYRHHQSNFWLLLVVNGAIDLTLASIAFLLTGPAQRWVFMVLIGIHLFVRGSMLMLMLFVSNHKRVKITT